MLTYKIDKENILDYIIVAQDSINQHKTNLGIILFVILVSKIDYSHGTSTSGVRNLKT